MLARPAPRVLPVLLVGQHGGYRHIENSKGEEDEKDIEDEASDSETEEYDKLCDEAHSMTSLLDKLEEMVDDKAGYPPLKGDLYLLMFMGRFGHMKDCISTLGILSIIGVQICGPFAVLFWAVYQIDWDNSTIMPLTYEPWTQRHGISHLLKVLLSVTFLFCFAVNGQGVVALDHEVNLKLKMLIWYANRDKSQEIEKHLHYHWLVLGRLINASLPIMCTICLFFLCILAEQPKDVVFDSLSMTFLYTLDDIHGPLGLLSSVDWDEERMGRLYFEIVNPEVFTQTRPRMALVVHKVKKYRRKFGSPIFMNAAWVMRFLAFALPIAFLFTDGIKVKVFIPD